ncbi:MAG: hypothetical protein GY940_07150 [bacterium]|nr:hypothetical protein [bacterium]
MIIRNKLVTEERDINVFHHSTSSAHIISFNSSITLPLQKDRYGDYLHISVVSGPGYLWTDCVITLPMWANFELSCESKLVVSHWVDHDQTRIKIPPGPPTWGLKIIRPAGLSPNASLTGDTIIIGDDVERWLAKS